MVTELTLTSTVERPKIDWFSKIQQAAKQMNVCMYILYTLIKSNIDSIFSRFGQIRFKNEEKEAKKLLYYHWPFIAICLRSRHLKIIEEIDTLTY